MPFSGVRSSWFILARNTDLVAFAWRATSSAADSASRLCISSFSAALRSETSRNSAMMQGRLFSTEAAPFASIATEPRAGGVASNSKAKVPIRSVSLQKWRSVASFFSPSSLHSSRPSSSSTVARPSRRASAWLPSSTVMSPSISTVAVLVRMISSSSRRLPSAARSSASRRSMISFSSARLTAVSSAVRVLMRDSKPSFSACSRNSIWLRSATAAASATFSACMRRCSHGSMSRGRERQTPMTTANSIAITKPL